MYVSFQTWLEGTCYNLRCDWRRLTSSYLLGPRQWTRRCPSPESCNREVSSFLCPFLTGWSDDDWWQKDEETDRSGWMISLVPASASLGSLPLDEALTLRASHSASLARLLIRALLSLVTSCHSCLLFSLSSVLHASSFFLSLSVSQWCHLINPQGPMTTKKIHKLL